MDKVVKRFDANNQESLEIALKKINKIKDKENCTILLFIKILEHFDNCIVIPKGYDDILIDITTYKELGNYYEISSNCTINEINVRLSNVNQIYCINSFEFLGECRFSGNFYNATVAIKDNVIGLNATGIEAKIKLFNNSVLHFYDKGASHINVLDYATFYGSASLIDVTEQGVVYSYNRTVIHVHSFAATVYAFNKTEIVIKKCYGDKNKSNITLYDQSSATIYSDMPNLICYDNSLVYACYNYQGDNSHYQASRKYKDQKHWYKVVIKDSQGTYRSIHDSSFVYKIGDIIKPRESFDNNPLQTCGSGIHLSTLQYAIFFGISSTSKKLVILELAPSSDAEIVIPYNSHGKIRVSEAKVLREVPLNELGDFKAIAKSEPFIYREESV